MSLVANNDPNEEFDYPVIDESHPSTPKEFQTGGVTTKQQVLALPTTSPPKEEDKGVEIATPAADPESSAKPKAEPKAKAPKKAASGVEMQTLSVRLTIPFYRAVHFHALERKELAQDFAARAVSAQLDREKDREVIYTRTSSRKPRTEEVQMLSASIPESLYQTMKKHVVVHGENVQIFAIRAFTEQIKIESE